jgi:predicted component of type VI protein secretion system
MPARLVALDEGPDILLDRSKVLVGRHPSCDARLESLRASRRHCYLTEENGEIFVRDLGSTNGIRINGERVEIGRLRVGDELAIAHLRYRVESGPDREKVESGLGPQPPAGPRSWIEDLLSEHSRIRFISRN